MRWIGVDWRIVRGVVCIKQRGREKLMYRGETDVSAGEVQTMREKSEYYVGGVCVRVAYVGLGVGGRVDTREGRVPIPTCIRLPR